MADLNKVMLLGRLTRDVELKHTPSNMAVAQFGMAVGRKWKTPTGEEREETAFVDCSAFGKLAEIVSQYAGKGKQVFVEGRLKLDQWEDKQSGQKRSKLSVVAENVILLGGKSDGDDAKASRPGGISAKPQLPTSGKPFDNEEIPF